MQYLYLIGGDNLEQVVKRILGRIFSRQFATEVSRTGRGTTKAAFTEFRNVELTLRSMNFCLMHIYKHPLFSMSIYVLR